MLALGGAGIVTAPPVSALIRRAGNGSNRRRAEAGRPRLRPEHDLQHPPRSRRRGRRQGRNLLEPPLVTERP